MEIFSSFPRILTDADWTLTDRVASVGHEAEGKVLPTPSNILNMHSISLQQKGWTFAMDVS